jgi:predicted Zn-dependent peptidase
MEKNPAAQYVTLIIKTDFGHDPADKPGLTELTNELMYLLFRDWVSVAALDFQTLGECSVFTFKIAPKDTKKFYEELDMIIRQEALLLYDPCNSLINEHKNMPLDPSRPALISLGKQIYGSGHTFVRWYRPQYQKITITDVNRWFRKIYRPNNMIISSSIPVPEEFLRRPAGRDFKETVSPPAIAVAKSQTFQEIKINEVHDNSSTVYMGFPAPTMRDEQFFPTLMGVKYLEDELTRELREENGLVYYVSVNYTYLSRPSSPMVLIVFQTLPKDTARGIDITLGVLRHLAANGLSGAKSTEIITRERKTLALGKQLISQQVDNGAIKEFTGQDWICNSELYLKELTQSTPKIGQSFTRQLSYLKIAVAGPAEMGRDLKEYQPDFPFFRSSQK